MKLEIIRKYAAAYTKIITASGFHPFYVDGFAGAGIHISKKTREYVSGSPLNALNTQPPFEKLFLVDLNTGKANHLREIAVGYKNVYIFDGDCNSVLLEKVFPECRYDKFQRALCVLDPYGLHLSWEVMREAARNRTIEFFLNFPVQDINRNVIWKNQAAVSEEQRSRLTFFWGNDSWKTAAYREMQDLFGSFQEKQSNEAIVKAFQERLKKVAGFSYVPNPLPMRNSRGATVYYLFFASHNSTAGSIIAEIFANYRDAK